MGEYQEWFRRHVCDKEGHRHRSEEDYTRCLAWFLHMSRDARPADVEAEGQARDKDWLA